MIQNWDKIMFPKRVSRVTQQKKLFGPKTLGRKTLGRGEIKKNPYTAWPRGIFLSAPSARWPYYNVMIQFNKSQTVPVRHSYTVVLIPARSEYDFQNLNIFYKGLSIIFLKKY